MTDGVFLSHAQTMTELFLPPPDGKDPLKNLDSKVKAALTREYNKVVHKSQAVSRELYQVNTHIEGECGEAGYWCLWS